VDITVKEDLPGVTKRLQALGLQVTGIYGRVISGLLPVNAIPLLAIMPQVQYARPAYKPMHQRQQVRPSMQRFPMLPAAKPVPVISQGDTAQLSYQARKKMHVDGKGVKLGILSDSYDNLGTAADGVRGGELPGAGNPFNDRKPVIVLQDLDNGTGTDEGRAMAEIVHDVAPGAEIAFHTAYLGQANFAQGIQQLADKGCQVIVDDVFYYDEPFFQDGIIAQSVDHAKKRGVSYFSAAGNNFNNSYESDYRSSNAQLLGAGNGTAHNFSAPADLPRYYQPIYIPPGGSFIASFQWDQPSFSAGGRGAESDLDIYLLDVNGSIVAQGAADNIASGDPIEVMGYTNQTSNYTFFIIIMKFAGADPSHLKYNMYNNGQFYLTSPPIPGLFAPTLVGHAKAAGAIATAAGFYASTPSYGVDTPRVEWFSSLAGVPNYFDLAGNRIAAVVRPKPDITAPDGGNTSFFDPFGNGDIPQDAESYPNFFGTSAAAPHAAGVAALMIEAEKLGHLTPDHIKGVLAATAIDMDNIYTEGFDRGFDDNTGPGFINAYNAVAQVDFPKLYIKDLSLRPLCSDNPAAARYFQINNPNPFAVQAHWLVIGTNQQGSLLAPPGQSIISTQTVSIGNLQLSNPVILDWEDNLGFTRLDIQTSSRQACGPSAERVLAEQQPAEVLPRPLLAEVFPNPSRTTFKVYLSLAETLPVQLHLYSLDGRVLLQKQVAAARGIVPIDAVPYKPGMYLLRVRQGNFSKTIKLIKQ
ncbi:MAG TPA: T9SS type A sorting domain-containing protein, partial [Chitinophagaceae bacterium]|nr:T9SS type A sorting domain-containing protein [Chitinophagaceae bacterium]